MCKCEAMMCVSICLWSLRRDDRSRVLVGAAETWRPDWRRRDVGVLIGQSTRMSLALGRGPIDSTRSGSSGCYTPPPQL